MHKQDIVVCGAGGHARALLDVLLQMEEYRVIGLLDAHQTSPQLGIPIIGNDAIFPQLYKKGVRHVAVAIGDNVLRGKIGQRVKEMGFILPKVISKRAVVSPHAVLGDGIFVNHGASVNACAHLGEGCIINTNSSVDHDCTLGEYVHIAPGVHISGGTTIGRYTFLGIGSVVIDGVCIGEFSTIGAGAAVIRDIPGHCTAVGVPACPLAKR